MPVFCHLWYHGGKFQRFQINGISSSQARLCEGNPRQIHILVARLRLPVFTPSQDRDGILNPPVLVDRRDSYISRPIQSLRYIARHSICLERQFPFALKLPPYVARVQETLRFQAWLRVGNDSSPIQSRINRWVFLLHVLRTGESAVYRLSRSARLGNSTTLELRLILSIGRDRLIKTSPQGSVPLRRPERSLLKPISNLSCNRFFISRNSFGCFSSLDGLGDREGVLVPP